MASVKLEPTLAIDGVVAALNVIQTAAIPGLPTWAHAVIAAVSVGLGAILNRAAVTPNAKVAAVRPVEPPPAPPAPPPVEPGGPAG